MSNKRILDIRWYSYYGNSIRFAGTLRNAKKFELFQKVFILNEGAMYQCEIVGIELPPESNPDYIYKVELPKDFIQKEKGETWIKDDAVNNRVSLQCDKIFTSIEEAKESALKELEIKFKLKKEDIESFFDQYEKKGNI